ncbi:LL-diaminopimelate aminotransferase, chloroplastic [Tanacetum coccineum]|uniref:LL-diaminopimelate aminotransferase, chloroplastic n=1 Tax=Tanacetum coccineum TaxID=301880 RepID=A0ABQ5GX48_9ASTR
MTRICSYAHGSPLLENSSAFKTQKAAEKPSAALGRILMLDFVIRNEDRLPRRLVVEQKKPYEIILISRGMSPSYAKGETLWIPLAKSDDDDAIMTSVVLQQVCHHDLKLENTLIDGSPAPLLKICDFSEILEKTHVVTTLHRQFRPVSEGFVRFSAFGHRDNVLEACRRFKELYKAQAYCDFALNGVHAPYVWVHFQGQSSWDVFSEILEKTHVVTTLRSRFGRAGERFVKVSAFGHRDNVLEACRRFKELYK